VDHPHQRVGVAGLHITGGLPVAIDLALEVDLLGDEPPAHKVNQLFYLSRESLKKRQIDELWKAKRATSPASLAQVLVVPTGRGQAPGRQAGAALHPPSMAAG
jgi:hypothetical protein